LRQSAESLGVGFPPSSAPPGGAPPVSCYIRQSSNGLLARLSRSSG
jgi:hypothetical protein